MHLRVTLALAAAAALTLTACGSGEPNSMKDLKRIAEKAGFDCGPESGEKGENVEASCGELGLVWYESEKAEQESYEALSSVYEDLPFETYTIRGDQWSVGSNKIGPMAEMAMAMDRKLVTLGN